MTTELARMYGGALFELAAEEKKDELVLTQLDEVCALFSANPDYVKLLAQPSLAKAERCATLDEAFGKSADPYLLNFLKILCEKGDIREVGGCAQVFRARYNEAHGIVEATATTAVALNAAQQKTLVQKLEAATGKTVRLTAKLDPACLGGLRLEMDGKQLDGTVQGRLAALRDSLAQITL